MNVPVVLGALGLLFLFLGLTSTGHGSVERPRAGGTEGRTVGWSVVCSLAGGAFGYLTTSSPALAAVLAGVSAIVPQAIVRRASARRARAVQEAWPEAIASAIAYLRSGASLGDALMHLSTRGPAVLRPAFAGFSGAYRSTGNLQASIAVLQEVARDPIADRVCVALKVAHEVGGSDLLRVMSSLSEAIRDDLRTRREVEARWSWTITAARLAAIAPWVVLALLTTKPEARRAYASQEGTTLIVVGGVIVLIGYALMMRIARLPLPKRIP